MFGKIIRIKRDYSRKGYVSKVGSSVYCGRSIPFTPNVKSLPVYFLSKKEPRDKFSAVVIGMINRESPKEKKLIVAPRGFVYYEPEIRALLSNINHQQITSLICRYEKSCGSVIIHNGPVPKVLIVKNKNSRSWGFPKGHIERDESERQTAIREVMEETGLKIDIIDGFREVSDYYSFGNAKKRVVFFLSMVDTTDIVLQKEELSAYKWLTVNEAIKLLEFKNNITILKRAIHFLKSKKLIQ